MAPNLRDALRVVCRNRGLLAKGLTRTRPQMDCRPGRAPAPAACADPISAPASCSIPTDHVDASGALIADDAARLAVSAEPSGQSRPFGCAAVCRVLTCGYSAAD